MVSLVNSLHEAIRRFFTKKPPPAHPGECSPVTSQHGDFITVTTLAMCDDVKMLMLRKHDVESVNSTVIAAYLKCSRYISNSSNVPITDLESALQDFQEKYNLPVSDEADNVTIQLVKRPRCALSENSYTVANKWSKTKLRCYFPPAHDYTQKVTEAAFRMWENAAVCCF
nr:unnamed protein product [Callosobruchus analis]